MEDTNYDKKAYGMFKKGGLFRLIEIPYSSATLETGTPVELPGELYNQTIAIEAYKLQVVKGGVFDGAEVPSKKNEEETNE